MCEGQIFPGSRNKVGILLPGAGYVPAAPLLWFARSALQTAGWTVLQVWDEWDHSDAERWVSDRFDAALREIGERQTVLVVAKSLTSLALPEAVERGLPGVWLTPLLTQDDVRAALEAATAPTMVVGGTADPLWDTDFVAHLGNVDVVEVAGADHSMQHGDDLARAIETLGVVTEHIRRFANKLARIT